MDNVCRGIAGAATSYSLGRQVHDAKQIYRARAPDVDDGAGILGESGIGFSSSLHNNISSTSSLAASLLAPGSGTPSKLTGVTPMTARQRKKMQQREALMQSENLKYSRRALKTVERMEKLLQTKHFERLIADKKEQHGKFFASSDSDSDDSQQPQQHDDVYHSGSNHQKQVKKPHPPMARTHSSSSSSSAFSPSASMSTAAAVSAFSTMQIDPNSNFSSEKLCKEFTAATRTAYRIANSADEIIEVALEERSMNWTNTDVHANCRDSLALSERLSQQVESLLGCATSFCGAAERVLGGARQEVRSASAELVALTSEADRLHASLEEKKSKLAKERKVAEDLRNSNKARETSLKKKFLVSGAAVNTNSSSAAGTNHNTGTSKRGSDVGGTVLARGRGSSSTLVVSGGGGSSRPVTADDDELETLRHRLRVLLSAASMQIRGQKSVEEEKNGGDGAGNSNSPRSSSAPKQKSEAAFLSSATTSRVLQAIDTVLAAL